MKTGHELKSIFGKFFKIGLPGKFISAKFLETSRLQKFIFAKCKNFAVRPDGERFCLQMFLSSFKLSTSSKALKSNWSWKIKGKKCESSKVLDPWRYAIAGPKRSPHHYHKFINAKTICMVTTLNSYFLHLGTLNKICFSRSRGSKNLIFCVAKNISEFSWTAFSHEPSGDYFFIRKKLIKLSVFVMTSRRCLFKLIPIVTFCSFNIYRKIVAIDTIRNFFWSECGKIRTRKNSVSGHFSRDESYIYRKNLCFGRPFNMKILLVVILMFRFHTICKRQKNRGFQGV